MNKSDTTYTQSRTLRYGRAETTCNKGRFTVLILIIEMIMNLYLMQYNNQINHKHTPLGITEDYVEENC